MVRFEILEPDWLSFPEALQRVCSLASERPPVEAPLSESLGLALAERVVARLTLPPGPTSHMDGYALRTADVIFPPGSRTSEPIGVLGAVQPGSPWEGTLARGEAVRIMTGALLPEGADTVVPVEDTDREHTAAGRVRVRGRKTVSEPARRGRYIRPAGEEMQAGDILADRGATVTPHLLTLLAATGEPRVPVHPPPRIALIVTGDELVDAGDPEALRGGVRRADIISPTLPPLIEDAGAVALAPVRVGDDEREIAAALGEASSQADLIITTGGASMGEADLVKRVLDDLGYNLDFWRVLMRPGSPVSLGRLPGPVAGCPPVPVLGLPGNPVSAVVTFLTLGYPAIRALGGHLRHHLPILHAVAGCEFGGPGGLSRFFRVRLDPASSDLPTARLSADQGSGVIRSMALADGLACVGAGTATVKAGERIAVLLLPHIAWSTAP